MKVLQPKSLNSQKRILVDDHNRVKSTDNVFAIGDLALMITEKYPYGHPMVAQVAIQQGKVLAANLMRLIKNDPVIFLGTMTKAQWPLFERKKRLQQFST